MEKTDNRLLHGILAQAEAQAAKAKADAEGQCTRILTDAREKVERDLIHEEQAQDRKMQQIAARLQANIGSADRRSSLRRMDEGYREVMRRVRRKLDAKRIAPYLPQWIAEAAIGLDRKEAMVAFSPLCPVDEKMLEEASSLVKQRTGAVVKLGLDPKPIRGLGVVLSSLDGKISFNNQVEIRLRRFDRDIRTMIQEHTCKAE